MGPDDVATPIQRDMGVHITRGIEPWRVLAQYMGRSGSPTRGRDGSVHLGDLSLGTIPMVSHLPAMLPVACGLALAFQLRREPRVALGWMGDGSAARGDAHEAMNFAGVRRLPMVFVIDNNQYAYTTPEPAGVRDRAPRRARRRLRVRGGRGRRHRPADRLPRGAPRRRARAGRARADADRVRDAAAVRPRRARRRELHAAGAARPLGRPRAGAARCTASWSSRPAGRTPRSRRCATRSRPCWTRRWSRRWPARCPTPTRCSTASTPRSRSFRAAAVGDVSGAERATRVTYRGSPCRRDGGDHSSRCIPRGATGTPCTRPSVSDDADGDRCAICAASVVSRRRTPARRSRSRRRSAAGTTTGRARCAWCSTAPRL